MVSLLPPAPEPSNNSTGFSGRHDCPYATVAVKELPKGGLVEIDCIASLS